MARLRAAQDHAARDATWEASRSERGVPASSRRGARPRDGRRVSRGAPQPRDGREDHPRRGAPLRSGPERRPPAPRSGAGEGVGYEVEGAAGRDRISPVRHIRHSVRLHRRHGHDAGDHDRSRGVRSGDGGAARQGARAERLRRQEGTGVRRRGGRPPEGSRRPFRGVHDDAGQRRTDRQLVRREADAGRRAGQRRKRIRRAGEDALLSRAGGQVSDSGRIFSEAGGASATVEGMVRIRAGLPRAHHVRVTSGSLRVRDLVTAEVDAEVRTATRRHHTATHLLHAALRDVHGTQVTQKGSLVAPHRLRFDFVHFQPVSREELERIERIVNEQIVRNTPVKTDVRPTQEAIAAGAMALFGEKYGDTVRVVSVPGFSMELCGGTHVSATGDIGFFAIVAEGGVAAGVRRIEAVTGNGAVAWAQRQRGVLTEILDALHAPDDQAVEAIEKLQSEAKRLGREVTQLKTKLAMGGGGSAEDTDTVEVAGVKLARRKVEGLDKDALRGLSDSLKARIKSGVVVLASASDGKVQIVVAVTPDLTSRVRAGQIVKEIAPIVGGGGGGRPDFAEAGGKQPEKIDEMLGASEGVLARLLGHPTPSPA